MADLEADLDAAVDAALWDRRLDAALDVADAERAEMPPMPTFDSHLADKAEQEWRKHLDTPGRRIGWEVGIRGKRKQPGDQSNGKRTD